MSCSELSLCVCPPVCLQLSLCGLGIIAPLSVAWSLVVGAVLSWGLLWPVLSTKEGSWFPSGEHHTHNHGFSGFSSHLQCIRMKQ